MGSRLEFATFCKHSGVGRSRCIWGRGDRVDKVGFSIKLSQRVCGDGNKREFSVAEYIFFQLNLSYSDVGS